tara:strand:+ start:1339 stop:1959 length:621 start_codon:yes stop_codon:yes gene_type:complete
MSFKKNVYAVILAGGLSSRMGGGIKSLNKFNNKFIFDRVFENLKKQLNNIIISSNDENNSFSKYKVRIIKDVEKGFLGPLAGIHASLEWINTNKKQIDWLITVPSDTPFIPKNLVEKLYISATKNNCKIILARSNNKTHPIIGIWHTSLYLSLKKDLFLGTRKILDYAIKNSLGYAEFFNSNYDPFFNINYKKDIIEAEKIENKYL